MLIILYVLADYLKYPPSKVQLRWFTNASTDQLQSNLGLEKFLIITKIGIHSTDILNTEFLDKATNIVKHYTPLPEHRTIVKRISSYFELLELFKNGYYEKVEEKGIRRLNKLPKRDVLRVEYNILLTYVSIILEKFNDALSYAQKALELAESFSLPWRKTISLLLLSSIHYHEGKYLLSESILQYTLNALEFDDSFIKFVLFNNLGLIQYHIGNFKKAYANLKAAYKEYKNTFPAPGYESIILQNLAKVAIVHGEIENAEKFLYKSIELAVKAEHDASNYAIRNALLIASQLFGYLRKPNKIKKIIRYASKITTNSPSFQEQLNSTKELIRVFYKMSIGDFGNAYKLLNKLEFEIFSKTADLILWQTKVYVNIVLYFITLEEKYLDEVELCIQRLIGIEKIIEHSLTNAQIKLMRVTYYYAKYDVKNFEKEKKEFLEYIRDLPEDIKKDYVSLVNALDMREHFSIILPVPLFFKFSLFINWRTPMRKEKINAQKEPLEIVFYALEDFAGPAPQIQLFNRFDYEFVLKQGAFLTTLVGGGDQYIEGFWGPMPTSDTNIITYVGTKRMYNANGKDKRKPQWTYALLVFYVDEKIANDPIIRKELLEATQDFYETFRDVTSVTPERFRMWVDKHFNYLNEKEVPLK